MHDQSFRSDVFLVGQYFLDLIFAGLSEVPRLGHEIYSRGFHMLPGGIANAAIAAPIGVRPGMAGSIWK